MTATTPDDTFLDTLARAPSAESVLKTLPVKRGQWGLELWSWVGRRGLDVLACQDRPALLALLEGSAAKAPFEDVHALFRRLEGSQLAFLEIVGCAQSYKKHKKAWEQAFDALPWPGRVLVAIGRAGGLPRDTRLEVDVDLELVTEALARSVLEGWGTMQKEIAAALGAPSDALPRRVASLLGTPLPGALLDRPLVVEALGYADWAVVEHVLAAHPKVRPDRFLLTRTDDLARVLSALGERAGAWQCVSTVVQLAAQRGVPLPDGYERAIVGALAVGVQDEPFVEALRALEPARMEVVIAEALEACAARGSTAVYSLLRVSRGERLTSETQRALREALAADRAGSLVQAVGQAGARGAEVLRGLRDELAPRAAAEASVARQRVLLQSGSFIAARVDPPDTVDHLLPDGDLRYWRLGAPLFEPWQKSRAMLAALPAPLAKQLSEAWARADFDGRLDVSSHFGQSSRRVDFLTADFDEIEAILPLASVQRIDLRVLGRADVPLERREGLLEALLARPDRDEHQAAFSHVLAMAYRELSPAHFAEGSVWDRTVSAGLPKVDATTLHWYVDKPAAAKERWASQLEALGKGALATELRTRTS